MGGLAVTTPARKHDSTTIFYGALVIIPGVLAYATLVVWLAKLLYRTVVG